MDGGAWWAAVHGVAKSWTRLSDFTFTFTFHFHALRRKWQPTPVFLPGESSGQRSLVGCRLWGRTELDTTDATYQRKIDSNKNSIRGRQEEINQKNDYEIKIFKKKIKYSEEEKLEMETRLPLKN